MTASVFSPENVATIDKNHREITKKTCVASALSDKQATIKTLVLNACHAEGMHSKVTKLTCLTDGANNCWSVTNSLKSYCKTFENVLDWFHITKRFTIILNNVGEDLKTRAEKVKWRLWHGNYQSGLVQLKSLINDTQENIRTSELLVELYEYIERNRQYLVNYKDRKENGLPFTSTYAEICVNCLVNDRQKSKRQIHHLVAPANSG